MTGRGRMDRRDTAVVGAPLTVRPWSAGPHTGAESPKIAYGENATRKEFGR